MQKISHLQDIVNNLSNSNKLFVIFIVPNIHDQTSKQKNLSKSHPWSVK